MQSPRLLAHVPQVKDIASFLIAIHTAALNELPNFKTKVGGVNED